MALRKVASCDDAVNCPAIHVDEETGDLVVQGYEADQATLDQLGLPAGEAAVRIPAQVAVRMGLV